MAATAIMWYRTLAQRGSRISLQSPQRCALTGIEDLLFRYFQRKDSYFLIIRTYSQRFPQKSKVNMRRLYIYVYVFMKYEFGLEVTSATAEQEVLSSILGSGKVLLGFPSGIS